MIKPIKIESNDCRYIDSTDNCFYFMEYHSRKGYDHSNENQLVLNFKKNIHETKGIKYKQEAIEQVASLLCDLLESGVKEEKPNYVFIPVPTSKSKRDKEYDDRLIKVLEIVKRKTGVLYYNVLDREDSEVPLHKKTAERAPSNHKMTINHEFIPNLQ